MTEGYTKSSDQGWNIYDDISPRMINIFPIVIGFV